MSLRNFSKLICVSIMLMVCQTSYANKSVFIISKHSVPSQAQTYRIDGHDLRVFCDDYWLWKADWFSIEQLQMMRAGSTTCMATLPESTSATIPYTPTPDQLLKFKPPQLDLEETIKWLEYLWLNDPILRENIDEKQWLEFIKAVEANFKDFLQ